jgi:hypothetical protein
MKKLMMQRTKPTQSSIFSVRYRAKIMDAGMSMPALVFPMPMPGYVEFQVDLYYSEIQKKKFIACITL